MKNNKIHIFLSDEDIDFYRIELINLSIKREDVIKVNKLLN